MSKQGYNKRIGNAWAMYDWANSVYSLVIGTAVFPLYYSHVVNPNGLQQLDVTFWGLQIDHAALLSYTISASFLCIALLLPILSGIADRSGRKKLFMQLFVLLGSLSCATLYFFDSQHLGIGIGASFGASLGFAGSLVFYNAFLPEIASPDRYDRLSAKGFSLGYLGSTILLVFTIVMIQAPQHFGLDTPLQAMRVSFLLVAIWWLGFSQITLRLVPEKKKPAKDWPGMMSKGLAELRGVWQQLSTMPTARRFLLAYFFISMGVQTIIYMASIYAKTELGFDSTQLITIILLIQLIAAAGAHAFAGMSTRRGNIRTMMVLTAIWAAICVMAFMVTAERASLFYVVAFLVGLVLGGIQSLARSTYAKLLPTQRDNASFFSFYEITEKVGITLGTLSFGLITDLVRLRYAPLLLGIYFIVALPLLRTLLHKPIKGS
ncbi:MAG: MFS transporter [Bacteroidetes bacterium]|nr:MFS transporter [Bacteroidota bacterium]